jgi:hypothetical protein
MTSFGRDSWLKRFLVRQTEKAKVDKEYFAGKLWNSPDWEEPRPCPVNAFRSMLIHNAAEAIKPDKGATMSDLPLYRRLRPDNLRDELVVWTTYPSPQIDDVQINIGLPGCKKDPTRAILSKITSGPKYHENKEEYINFLRNTAMNLLDIEHNHLGIECTEISGGCGSRRVAVRLEETHADGEKGYIGEEYVYPPSVSYKEAKRSSLVKFRKRQRDREVYDREFDRDSQGFTPETMQISEQKPDIDRGFGVVTGCAYNLIVNFVPRSGTKGTQVSLATSFSEELMHNASGRSLRELLERKVIEMGKKVSNEFLERNRL